MKFNGVLESPKKSIFLDCAQYWPSRQIGKAFTNICKKVNGNHISNYRIQLAKNSLPVADLFLAARCSA